LVYGLERLKNGIRLQDISVTQNLLGSVLRYLDLHFYLFRHNRLLCI
jgi:hypothetical protein